MLYVYIKEGNIMNHLRSLDSICNIPYWTANFPTKRYCIIKTNCRQTQIIENIYMCERAERASFENLRIFLNLIYHYAQWYSKGIIKICGGALFVGAPGQLPTLPSPKSGPDSGQIVCKISSKLETPSWNDGWLLISSHWNLYALV